MTTKWRITGTVSKDPFTNDKFGKLPVMVEANGRKSYFDVKSFDKATIAAIARMKPGDEVTAEGELMSETVRDGKDALKDSRGKDVWVTGLKATSVTIGWAGAPRRKPEPPPPPVDDSEVPF
jgi:hypothetical protein